MNIDIEYNEKELNDYYDYLEEKRRRMEDEEKRGGERISTKKSK